VPADCTVNPPQDWVRYNIRVGDTLSGLAQRTGARLGDLALVNCIRDPRVIVVGMPVFVPRQPSPSLGNTNANGNLNANVDDHGSDNSGNDNASHSNSNDNTDDHGNDNSQGGDDHGGDD